LIIFKEIKKNEYKNIEISKKFKPKKIKIVFKILINNNCYSISGKINSKLSK
jgi:hypothetical protein